MAVHWMVYVATSRALLLPVLLLLLSMLLLRLLPPLPPPRLLPLLPLLLALVLLLLLVPPPLPLLPPPLLLPLLLTLLPPLLTLLLTLLLLLPPLTLLLLLLPPPLLPLLLRLRPRQASFYAAVIVFIYAANTSSSIRFCVIGAWLVTIHTAFLAYRFPYRISQYIDSLHGAYSGYQLYAVPLTNRTHFVIFCPEDECQIGASQFNRRREELGPMVLPEDDEDSKRVHGITTKIVEAAKRIMPHTHVLLNGWEVIVIKDDKRVNASCLPGCKISVYTGLLKKFEDDAELATVLSHEVSHAIARHAVEKRTANSLWSRVFEMYFIFPFMSLRITRPAVEFVVRTLHNFCVMLPLARRTEEEADRIGLSLLAAAGYDPRDAPSVWRRLGDISGDSELRNYVSTHPSIKKRVQLLLQDHVMNEALKFYSKR